MSVLRFFLLGRFEVQCDQQPLDGFEPCKLQELMSFLLLYRHRMHPRETVASLLWGKYTTAQSKKHLRHALWQVQEALDPYLDHSGGCLLCVDADWVGINPQARFWLDVAALEAIIGDVYEIPGDALDAGQVEALEAAACIYRGDLLDGCYHDWCLFERERLQNVYLAVLDKLMTYHEALGAHEACLTYGTRILSVDRASERTHRRMMRAYHRAGDRTAALRQYQRCVTALRQELDVEPGRRTQALYHRICADTLDRSLLMSAEDVREPMSIAALPQVLLLFRQLQQMLVDLNRQVQQDIEAMERALE